MLTVIGETLALHILPRLRLTGVSTCQVIMVCFTFPSADELLQEQKSDIDQFMSSISESQPDVTVSSEESVEVPVSEGKPYRPFQVTSLGSRSEPEGEHLQPQTQSHAASRTNTVAVWRTIGHTYKSLWRTLVTKHTRTVVQRERKRERIVYNAETDVLWSHGFGLICACTVPCGPAFNAALLKFR